MALLAPYNPVELTELEIAFPAHAVDRLMPSNGDIPDDFHRDRGEAKKWVKLQRKWFFEGIDERVFVAKDGIDYKTAIRHLSAVQGSFEPSHEHKEAAVAWLMSLWFDLNEPVYEEMLSVKKVGQY
ncbi:MAG TPA: hypothetical protein VIY48_03960 [Candidatus Paceibacterota bacterium]